mmetsp:Transcript_2140/g.2749  ORF Transcript_2140/g.2749 Transcript_2140/m.2749 type:complete len:174 (-) Transcript_2140:174-695(-)
MSRKTERLLVDIPANAKPGQKLQVEKDGETYLIICPRNVKPGTQMELIVKKKKTNKTSSETEIRDKPEEVKVDGVEEDAEVVGVEKVTQRPTETVTQPATETEQILMKERQEKFSKSKSGSNAKSYNAEEARQERMKELHATIGSRKKDVSKTVGLYEHEKWLKENVIKEARF